MTPEQLDKFFDLIEIEKNNFIFSDSSESNFLRIIMGMYNKRAFIEECLKYPPYIEIIVSISVNSNYLTDILVRDPENFYWIVNPSMLNSKLNSKAFPLSLSKSLESYNLFHSKLNAIRSIKRKEILRIGVKDILGIDNLKTVTEELSVLAKGISSILFQICYNEILKKYNVTKIKSKYCLIALGKLGGNELNYSSDIDLMIFYDSNTMVTDIKDYHEFLTQVIQLFIESATSITNEGFIYRIDFRLRPDGKNSSLCNSYESYINYYESRGEDWERQMLIKASMVCGDSKLYHNFADYLSHFIYPESFSTSPLQQIKKLKNAIENKLRNEENIKLASGGIRNIEFSVQALQLLNGGKFPEVRTQNTLDAIKVLGSKGLLSKEESKIFIEAYTFYRKIEHYLQLMNDTQTHTIPSEGVMLDKLSNFLGFKTSGNFNSKVENYRRSVLTIYNSIIGSKGISGVVKQSEKISFHNKISAEKDLDYLRSGKGLLEHKLFDMKTSATFNKIETGLIDYLTHSKNPDIVLKNFARILRNVPFPSIWYTEFTDIKFFRSFLTIIEFNQMAVNLFSEDNNLREYFITKKIFEKLNPKYHNKLDTKKFIFHLLCCFTLKLISAEKVSILLKNYFADRIRYFSEKSILLKNGDYFIAALGSFGSGEMSFSSDIDLIFVINKSAKPYNNEKLFQSFLAKLKKEFHPFTVDCRLRPEGKSSQLVWELDSYIEYLSKRARTWEFQSFCKLFLVAGEKSLFNKFVKAIDNRLSSLDKNELKKDILEMRKKTYPGDFSGLAEIFNVKKSRGGIIDIEFMLQFLILSNPKYYLSLRGKRNVQVIKNISKTNNNIKTQNSTLINDYYYLKNFELAIQSIFDTGNSQIVLGNDNLEQVISFLNIKSAKDFKNNLSKIIKFNNTLFKTILSKA